MFPGLKSSEFLDVTNIGVSLCLYGFNMKLEEGL